LDCSAQKKKKKKKEEKKKKKSFPLPPKRTSIQLCSYVVIC